ncbi:MAG TPA: hypothetical protein VK933_14895 [Longimicrobiales bacterium]|nr:hypothetical protein [Longimicrobiales bacterium]
MTDGGIIEAVVQVGAQETHYLRCGRGDRVVVVLTGDAAERLRLMRHYADGGRVIAPVPPMRDTTPPVAAGRAAGTPDAARRWPGWMAQDDDGRAAADWIFGVIDGLGLDRPAVVLAPDLAWLAARLIDGSGDAFHLLETIAPSR